MNRRFLMRFLLWFCLLSVGMSGYAAESENSRLSAADFIARVRRPSAEQSYAKLSGEIKHLRRGGETETAPIYLGVLLTGNRRLSQVIVNNNEGYRIGQAYTQDTEGTTVTPMNPDGYPDSVLADFGVKPEDLSMSFLYWKLMLESQRTTFRTADCRVFLLKNPANDEAVRAYVTTDYLFPVKVEFFADGKNLSEPVRTMEVEKFQQTDSGFWVPTQLKLYGPGWRTIVSFEQTEAEKLDPSNPPQDVMRTLPEAAAKTE